WQAVPRVRLAPIFERFAISAGESNRYAALMIFQNLDLEHLQEVASASLKSMLEFLKARNWDFRELILANLDLYDYVARLARDLGDSDFARLLDGHVGFAVQVRIAEDFADEIRQARDDAGTVSLARLVPIVERIPRESVRYALEIV